MAIILLRESGSITAPGAIVRNLPLTNVEVDNNFSNLSIAIGINSNLSTTNKSNLVAAINEVSAAVGGGSGNVSAKLANTDANVSTLFALSANSATKIDITNVNANVNTINSNVGILPNLLTTAKNNVVVAINELKTQVGSGTLSGVTISNSTWNGNAIPVANGGTGATTSTNARINLGLGTIATQDANAAVITGGSITGNVTMNVSANIAASFFLGDGSKLSNVAGSGSGAFNTAINGVTGALLGTPANVFVVPNVANTRYVIHSIHVTNINGVSVANVSGNFNGATYANVSFAKTIPVPGGAAVELLRKPKVLNPGDYITMEADLSNYLHATIITERVSTALHFGSGLDLTVPVTYNDIYIANANSIIESILLSNDDGVFDVKSRAVWTDAANTILGYYCFDLIVPADATIELLDNPKFLESGMKVKVYTNVGDRLEAIIAGKTIGS